MSPLTYKFGLGWSFKQLDEGVQLTARQIMTQIAEKHGLTLPLLISHNRTKKVARARHEALWTCRQVVLPDGSPRWSLTTLGNILGGRDHTTVLHSLRRWEEIQSGGKEAVRKERLPRVMAWSSTTPQPVARAIV